MSVMLASLAAVHRNMSIVMLCRDLGTIRPDRTATVTIRVVPTLAGAIINSAFALSSKPDSRGDDNTASITTTVTG